MLLAAVPNLSTPPREEGGTLRYAPLSIDIPMTNGKWPWVMTKCDSPLRGRSTRPTKRKLAPPLQLKQQHARWYCGGWRGLVHTAPATSITNRPFFGNIDMSHFEKQLPATCSADLRAALQLCVAGLAGHSFCHQTSISLLFRHQQAITHSFCGCLSRAWLVIKGCWFGLTVCNGSRGHHLC